MIRIAVGAIITYRKRFLIVHKTKINTTHGKKNINGEWDFVKGGVQSSDSSLKDAILRELKEETGCSDFEVVKQFDEKLCFDFPRQVQSTIGYRKQETTMFHVEYVGDMEYLQPSDTEISAIEIVDRDTLLLLLTHSNTRNFFNNHFEMR
ncbi:NUDIX hydrolase [Ornithinibacillus salinisoli]|uniref:NUDIX hydrolase n=1 Tax=Ornithinibacillus salinisoli TaxID=1848459 RepID=A0ABW4VWF5_9BACI